MCNVLLLRPDRGPLCEDLTDPITVITMIKGRVLKRREQQSSQSLAKCVCVYHLRGGRGAVCCSIHIHHLFNVRIRLYNSQSLSFCVHVCVFAVSKVGTRDTLDEVGSQIPPGRLTLSCTTGKGERRCSGALRNVNELKVLQTQK